MAVLNTVAPTSPVREQQFHWPEDPFSALKLTKEQTKVIEIALRWARSTQELSPYEDGRNSPYVMEKDTTFGGETGPKLPCRVDVWSDKSLIETPQKLWPENSCRHLKMSGVNAQFYCPDDDLIYRKRAVPHLADQADVLTEAANEEIDELLQEAAKSGKPLDVCSSPEDFKDE